METKKLALHNVHRVITPVNNKFGAPMGRSGKGEMPPGITSGRSGRMFKKDQPKIYDKRVPMCSCCGAYDEGGAYWGTGRELRVMFTPDLSYIEYYRVGDSI